MKSFTVALLQMASHGADQPANLAKGEDFCRRAKALGADLALFPEMWNIGYTGFAPSSTAASDLWRAPGRWQAGEGLDDPHAEARTHWQAQAIATDSDFVNHYRHLARALEMALVVTYLQRWPGAPRNAAALINRHGDILFTYAKVHTCDFDEQEWACTPGDDFYVAELDTATGPVQVGVMICFDREFPESARVLMLKGAEVIAIPNACEMEIHRRAQLHTRAYENMVGVALANYAAPQEKGHSLAYDPIAFDEQGSRNTLLMEAGEAEGVYLAQFDVEALRQWRTNEVWGNAFRRPRAYTALTDPDVQPPFVRVNAAGEVYHQRQR